MAKDMRNKFWLFRKLNLNLRVEIIINISLLMLVAILLIGFSISKINEKNMIQDKIRNGEGMVKDIQAIIDFMSQEKKEFSLSHPQTKKAIQDFVRIYTKERGFYDLMVLDTDMNVITSKKAELIDKPTVNDLMKKSIQFGHSNTEIEKSGNVLFV